MRQGPYVKKYRHWLLKGLKVSNLFSSMLHVEHQVIIEDR